jgi:hypothetical protein
LRAIVLQVLRLPLRLLMMGIRMPETFWDVFKQQARNL